MHTAERLIAIFVIFGAVGTTCYLFAETLLSRLRAFLRMRRRALSDEVSELEMRRSSTFYLVAQLSISALLFLIGSAALNVLFGCFLGCLGYVTPGIYFERIREKRRKRLTRQMVDVLELMGNALKSGLTLPQALELVVREFPPPISTEFSQTLNEHRLGVELRVALENLARRVGLPVFRILSTGVSVTLRCGGDLTVIFQHIAETIRARAKIDDKIEAVSSLGKFQALILSAMPFLLMIMLFFIDRPHIETLFSTKAGLAGVGVTVFLVFVANFWINRLTKVDV